MGFGFLGFWLPIKPSSDPRLTKFFFTKKLITNAKFWAITRSSIFNNKKVIKKWNFKNLKKRGGGPFLSIRTIQKSFGLLPSWCGIWSRYNGLFKTLIIFYIACFKKNILSIKNRKYWFLGMGTPKCGSGLMRPMLDFFRTGVRFHLHTLGYPKNSSF